MKDSDELITLSVCVCRSAQGELNKMCSVGVGDTYSLSVAGRCG